MTWFRALFMHTHHLIHDSQKVGETALRALCNYIPKTNHLYWCSGKYVGRSISNLRRMHLHIIFKKKLAVCTEQTDSCTKRNICLKGSFKCQGKKLPCSQLQLSCSLSLGVLEFSISSQPCQESYLCKGIHVMGLLLPTPPHPQCKAGSHCSNSTWKHLYSI